MRHAIHFENEPKILVKMLFPNHRNPQVQIFDALQAEPPESYPYFYEPSLPSLNRLLRCLTGWSVQVLDTGAWEWRKPKKEGERCHY